MVLFSCFTLIIFFLMYDNSILVLVELRIRCSRRRLKIDIFYDNNNNRLSSKHLLENEEEYVCLGEEYVTLLIIT